jgi:hypothetical protein
MVMYQWVIIPNSSLDAAYPKELTLRCLRNEKKEIYFKSLYSIAPLTLVSFQLREFADSITASQTFCVSSASLNVG